MLELIPTPEQPYPSVQTPAGLFVWDPDLNSLRNTSVEAPNRAKLPWGLEVFINGEPFGDVQVSDLLLHRDIIRALTLLYLGRRDDQQYVQFRSSYNTGATVAWVDPSLDQPVNDTFKRWPADWNGLEAAEIQIKGGLGYNV